MTEQQGIVEELNREYVTQGGKERAFLKVSGTKYYADRGKVEIGVVNGSQVVVEYQLGSQGNFRFVDTVYVDRNPPVEGKVPPKAQQTQGEPAKSQQPAPADTQNMLYIKQTALNCASRLIAAKVFAAPTGPEGVCALANQLVEYLRTGKMPEIVKHP